MIDPVLAELDVADAALASVPFVSGVTGKLMSGVADTAYWRRQAREPVAFGTAATTLADFGAQVLVEIGPHSVLGPMAALAWPHDDGPTVIASQRREGTGDFRSAVGAAFEAGIDISFEGLFAGEERRRVELPTYPFQRKRYWARPPASRAPEDGHPVLGVRHDSRNGEVSFEIDLSREDPAWLGDHLVVGEVVAPAALYAGQVIEAVRQTRGDSAVSLEDVQVHRPLVLPGREKRRIQVVLGPEGRWEVTSREAGRGKWELHAEGRWASNPGDGKHTDLQALEGQLTGSRAAEFYEQMAAAGIELGPSFQGLTAFTTGDGDAWGEVTRLAQLDNDRLAAHPAHLDACFQVVAGILAAHGESGRYLPIGWDHLWLNGPLPARLYCHAQPQQVTQDTVKGDLVLYTPDGESCGEILGFTLKRASRMAILGSQVDHLLHETVWHPSPAVGHLGAGFVAGPEALASSSRPIAEFLRDEGLDSDGVAELVRELERESRWFALQGLADLGWQRCSGDRFEPEALQRKLKVRGKYRRLFQSLFRILAGAGIVASDSDGGWVVSLGADDPLPKDIAIPEGPAETVELSLLRRCGASLSKVLSDRADPLEVLFGDEPGAADLYSKSGSARAVNRMVGELVAAAVRGLPDGRQLKVLEVGAGTGATTDSILSQLPAGCARYYYTDISAAFLASAERRFGKGEVDIRYRTLDIERDPSEQGIELHSYDLVLAANALHATRNLGESLRHCRSLLAPSGLLVAVEGTLQQGWLDLTFGLLPGWWRFEDLYRPNYALASRETWERALADAGYEETSFLDGESGQIVILASGPAEVEPEPGTFVLAGGGVFAKELASELERRRQTVVMAPSDSVDRQVWRSLFEELTSDAPLRSVAYLDGIRVDGSGLSTPELRQELRAVGSGALALVQGMWDADARPINGVLFATRGGQVLGGERTGALSGSALWGFGSSMHFEHANLRPRLVDLDPGADLPVAVMADELMFPDREDRIALRGGERWVPRLVRSTGPAQKSPVLVSGRAQAPSGQLRADRSYLVTGGLGGIGLELAGWLAEAGVGAIVLNGRREPGAKAETLVAELRERGIEVRVEVADVTDPAAVDAMLARVDSELPPLGGIIHCVGVLADAPLVNLDWERFEEVLQPKVLGAWHLHLATLDRDLDLFVMFSSLAGVLGSPGQANHAAANAFLDQLAHHRRALGVAGQSIAWGAWSEVGEAEEQRERIEGRIAALGESWITPERGLRALERVVQQNTGTSVVVDMDWSALSGLPLLDQIRGDEDGGDAARAEPASPVSLRHLDEAQPAERRKLLSGFLQEEVRSVLGLDALPDLDIAFADLGMDSLMAVTLRQRLNAALPRQVVSTTAVFEFPDVGRLAEHLISELYPSAEPARPLVAAAIRDRAAGDSKAVAAHQAGIAVVGMACQFPGGPDLAAFWSMLREGRDAVTKGRPGVNGDADRFGAYVPDLDKFDAEFFAVAPAEARYMDPQQRMLLEVSWTALEHAGIDPSLLRGSRSGVYVGIGVSEYGALLADARKDLFQLYRYLGTSPSGSVSRVSSFFGLKGPALGVEAACSSGLVAVHHAMTALQRGEVDLALAGGVNTILGHGFAPVMEAGILSPDGRSRAFDASADGVGLGEGCGMLVLKRLADAEADGDGIMAILGGSAVRQTGTSSGLAVPSRSVQQEMLAEALERSGTVPADVDYLEASAGGSLLGDAGEVEAAVGVYGPDRGPDRPLLIGSVKSNVSNMQAAGGVASLIKVIQSMQHSWIPGQVHFRQPNPQVDWQRLPVRVVSEGAPWPIHPERTMRAGVSSFGFSGTIAHVVVEEYRSPESSAGVQAVPAYDAGFADTLVPEVRATRLLPLSAKTEKALRELAGRYRSWLANRTVDRTDAELLADLAWSAGVGRRHFPWRAGLVTGDLSSIDQQLSSLLEGRRGVRSRSRRQVAFVFGGNPLGRMGRDLYMTEPAVRSILDRCEHIFREERDASLLEVMFGYSAKTPEEPSWAVPALVALGAALGALWESLGIQPDVVAGQGAGALTAASAAGVLSFEDAIRFAARRSTDGGRVSADAINVALGDLRLEPPSLPLVSAANGEIAGREVLGVDYWMQAARKPASRRRLLSCLAGYGADVLVEVGPRVVSPAEVSRTFGKQKPLVLASPLEPVGAEGVSFTARVADAYEAGLELSFSGMFAGERRQRLRIPTYPFQRERHWFA